MQLPPISHLILGALYWPIAMAIIFPFGIVGGFIFKALACLQVYTLWISHDYREWKRYRGRVQFLDHMVVSEKLKAESDPSYTPKCRAELSISYPQTPFPWRSMIASSLLLISMLVLYPFIGVFQGVQALFNDSLDLWGRLIGVDPNIRYERLLKQYRKANKNEFEMA